MKKKTIHAPNFMDYFKSDTVVKIQEIQKNDKKLI